MGSIGHFLELHIAHEIEAHSFKFAIHVINIFISNPSFMHTFFNLL